MTLEGDAPIGREGVGRPPQAALDLRRLLAGFQVTQAIHVAAVLGVADHMSATARPAGEIAAAVGADADCLYRLLRALAALGVLVEHEGRRFALAAMGECLRTGSPHSVRPFAIYVAQQNQWDAWGHLLHSVRTGENAFRALHGVDCWEYRAARPEQNAIFNAAMTGSSRWVERAIVDAYDFGRCTRVADIAGGEGSLLAALLRAHPGLRGVLFDQPHVIASAGRLLAAAGVADRCEAIGGDMMVGVPPGCDTYVMKYVLHDWDDAHCLRILRACRAAMTPAARLIVIDRLLGPPNQEPIVALADLHMLVGPGGRERAGDEFAALFEAAGLRLAEVRPTGSPVSLLVGECA